MKRPGTASFRASGHTRTSVLVALVCTLAGCQQPGVPGARNIVAPGPAAPGYAPPGSVASIRAALSPGAFTQANSGPEPMPVNGVGYVLINAPIASVSRDFFVTSVDKLRAAGAREIDLGLNSPGGSIDAAQDIVDYMARVHRSDGITFKAYNLGFVASAATYIFLSAQDRYSSPRGTFLFHAASVVSEGPANSERLREEAEKLDAYDRTVRATLVARTHLTAGEAQTYVRRTVVLNADDARRDGVVDGIAEFRAPAGARAYMISSRPPPVPQTRPATPPGEVPR